MYEDPRVRGYARIRQHGERHQVSSERRSDLLFTLGTKFAWLLVLGLGRSARIRFVGRQNLLRLREENRRFILAVWHGRLLLPVYLHRNEGICAMVSLHRDGELIAQTIQRLGYTTVRGSSTRGGREAFNEMVRAIRAGANAAIIPDGPTGPRHQLKPGVLFIAQQTGAAILPLTFACDRYITFNSWDRFTLWKPFAKCVAVYGDPFYVPRTWTLRQVLRAGKELEQKMIEQEAFADALFRE